MARRGRKRENGRGTTETRAAKTIFSFASFRVFARWPFSPRDSGRCSRPRPASRPSGSCVRRCLERLGIRFRSERAAKYSKRAYEDPPCCATTATASPAGPASTPPFLTSNSRTSPKRPGKHSSHPGTLTHSSSPYPDASTSKQGGNEAKPLPRKVSSIAHSSYRTHRPLPPRSGTKSRDEEALAAAVAFCTIIQLESHFILISTFSRFTRRRPLARPIDSSHPQRTFQHTKQPKYDR